MICGVHIRRDVTSMGIVCDISVWCVTVVTDTCSLVIETSLHRYASGVGVLNGWMGEARTPSATHSMTDNGLLPSDIEPVRMYIRLICIY